MFAALAAAQLNVDNVVTLINPSTKACDSAFLEDESGKCLEQASCSAKYALETIDPLKTEFPTSLAPGRVVGTNSLEIVVQHEAVKGRQVTRVVLNENNKLCNYPGPNWNKGVEFSGANCIDTYASNIPWATAYAGGGSVADQAANACNLARSENATHVEFLGKGTVFYTDPLPALDGITPPPREVSSVVQFKLIQPKVIRDIKATVTTLDEPRLLSAISRQLFDYTTGLTTFSLILSLAAPLRTDAVATMAAPSGISFEGEPTVDNTNCADDAAAVCQQTYTWILSPGQECQFDGDYDFTFDVGCQPSIRGTAACPTDMTTMPMALKATLDSEDICEVIQGLLEAEGSMTSHGVFTASPFGFGPEKTAFFQTQPVYFQVQVKSSNGFPFEKSKIILVEIEDKEGDRKTIMDAGSVTDGWAYADQGDPANDMADQLVHTHQFTYKPDAAVFGDVERNKPIDSAVVVAVEIVFQNSLGPARRRRRVVRTHRFGLRQAVDDVLATEVAGQVTVEFDPDAPVVDDSMDTMDTMDTMEEDKPTDKDPPTEEESSASSSTLAVLAVAAMLAAAL